MGSVVFSPDMLIYYNEIARKNRGSRGIANKQNMNYARAGVSRTGLNFSGNNSGYFENDSEDPGFSNFSAQFDQIKTNLSRVSPTAHNGKDMYCNNPDASLIMGPLGWIAELSCHRSAITDAYKAAKRVGLNASEISELQRIMLNGCDGIPNGPRRERCAKFASKAIYNLGKKTSPDTNTPYPDTPSGPSGPNPRASNEQPLPDYDGGSGYTQQVSGGIKPAYLIGGLFVVGIVAFFIIKGRKIS